MLHEVLLFADTCRSRWHRHGCAKRLSMSFPRLFVFILGQLLLLLGRLLGRLPLLLGRLLLQRQSPDTMDERVLPRCCTWDTGPGDRRGFASIGQNIWYGSNDHLVPPDRTLSKQMQHRFAVLRAAKIVEPSPSSATTTPGLLWRLPLCTTLRTGPQTGHSESWHLR
jgi:hypothetical protein